MCIINSHKFTVPYQCYQKTTVKVSCHLTKYNILYKNDKLARPILMEIVNPIEKYQTINYNGEAQTIYLYAFIILFRYIG